MTHIMTRELQLSLIEGLIQRRSQKGNRRDQETLALKSIASDLRAALAGTRSEALGEIEHVMVALYDSKTPDGYGNAQLIRAALTMVKRWAFVRLALEHYGEETHR